MVPSSAGAIGQKKFTTRRPFIAELDDITAYAQCATRTVLKWRNKQKARKNQTNYLQIVGPLKESHKFNAWQDVAGHENIIEYETRAQKAFRP